MNSFVTETLPEDLNVLLFSQSPLLADLFADQLQQHGLQVTRKSSDESSLTNFLESGISPTWYKVFWIDDVDHLSITQAKKITKIFQEIKGLSYVVTHQPFEYHGHKKFEQTGNLLNEIDVFFAQRSPYTSFLTFRDVLTNELFSLNYQQIIHFLHQSKFPFDQDNLGFISDTEMIEGIVSLSFDPRGGKRRVVVSKKPLATKTIMRAIQAEFRRRFKGEDVLVQNDVGVLFNSEFKEFPVPTKVSQEELVSELIVEAKFHYKPEKVESREEASDIPRPLIPKAKSVDKEDVSAQASDIRDRSNEDAEKRENSLQRKINIPDEDSEEPTEKAPSLAFKKPPTELPPKKQESKTEKFEPKHATQLRIDVPPTTYHLSPATLSQLVPKSIQEPSIHVLLESPVVANPRGKQVMIPATYIPEIRRSKIILHQLNSNLEKPVTVRKKEFDIPYLNARVAEKVRQEKAEPQPKKEEPTEEEDHQKKLLEKKIASLFSGTLKPQKTLTLRRPQKSSPLQILFGQQTRVGKWYRAQKGAVLLSGAVIGTTILLVSTFFISLSLLQRQLIQLAQSFEEGSVISTSQSRHLGFTQSLVGKQLGFYSTFLGTGVFSDSISELEASKKISELIGSIQVLQKAHTQALLQFLGAQSGDPIQTLNPVQGQAENIYKQLSLLEAELKQTDTTSFFQTQFTAAQQKDFLDSLSQIRREVLVGQQMTAVLPNILAKSGKKTVAVVLQDSAELRGTGGFVQTVVLVTISNGQIIDLQTLQPDKITEAVGGQVTPPDEVKEYLGEQQWFLRDGNWNPSFEVTGKQLAWFIEKGTNTPIDGVIGINTISLARLLSATGPVTLKDFKDEIINEKNLSEREYFYAKSSLTDVSGGAAKPDFLSEVLKSAVEKLKTMDADQANILIDVATEQLKQDEITVYSNDLGIQGTLATLGWTGSVILPPCPAQIVQDQCLVSNIYQVDSNVGVNKVNYSIKKKVEHSIQVTPDKIVHKRDITYENSNASNSWPGGVYKNYVRWYVPPKAKLLALTVNGVAVDTAKIKQYQDRGSEVFGTLIEILPQTTSKVSLEYEEAGSMGKQSSLAFFDQKQPGTGNTPTKITVFYDDQFVPTVIAPEADISGNKIIFSLLGDQHSFVGVKFK